MLVQCWPVVYDVVPKLSQHWVNVFAGYDAVKIIEPSYKWRIRCPFWFISIPDVFNKRVLWYILQLSSKHNSKARRMVVFTISATETLDMLREKKGQIFPKNTRPWPNAVLMLIRRLWRWVNIKTALVLRLFCATVIRYAPAEISAGYLHGVWICVIIPPPPPGWWWIAVNPLPQLM